MNDCRALLVKSGEDDPIVFGCGTTDDIARLSMRFTVGGSAVASEAGAIPCCLADPDAGLWCHLGDDCDEDMDRRRLVLALALARSEGEENVATWLATRVVDTETQFPPGVARMLLEYVAR